MYVQGFGKVWRLRKKTHSWAVLTLELANRRIFSKKYMVVSSLPCFHLLFCLSLTCFKNYVCSVYLFYFILFCFSFFSYTKLLQCWMVTTRSLAAEVIYNISERRSPKYDHLLLGENQSDKRRKELVSNSGWTALKPSIKQ